MVKQISVFLENKEGRLADVTKVLGDRNINIRALSIADTTDYGILRLIVNDPSLAYQALKEADFAVSVMEVLAIGISDVPGSLAKALRPLQENAIVIEYMYAFIGTCGKRPLVILKVSDIEKALAILKANNVPVIDEKEVYSL